MKVVSCVRGGRVIVYCWPLW
ncbi:hypothetical protein Goklo_007939 [Gossypium klotzschianum]|uniref:Uncharacterized protein n=1 Tax=Gossypium klotzschianum TaxID=34286 RepID=A0A7J8UZ21_9ROSI|nr:hypothetical protein [Gossypium klotzschianum]